MQLHQMLTASVVVLVALLAACAHQSSSNGVIIDRQGVNMNRYYDDMADCEQYAEEVQVASRTAKQSAGGAIVGGALGAIWGNSDTAARGAGAGGLLGGVKGFSQASREKQQVVKRCLRGRGYRVLN